MTPKAILKDQNPESKILALCKTLEEGGVKFPDNLIAFSKQTGKQ